MTKTAKSFKEMDILKALAVIAVVLIHVFSVYRYHFIPQNSQSGTLMIVFDQIYRITVPFFVILSGMGLMFGYQNKKFEIKNFFLARAFRILPWYLFFATLIILAVTFVFHESSALYQNQSLKRLYLFGRADYHLYFVPMIIQFYFLFPVLLFLFRRLRPVFIVILAFLWQVFWYLLISRQTEIISNNNAFWPDQVQYVSAAGWFFYFIFGMYLAGKINNLSRRTLAVLFAIGLVGLVWTIVNSLGLLNQGMDIIVATRFTRLPVLIYVTGTFPVVWWIASSLGRFKNILVTVFISIGKQSYIIYLLHTLVLRCFFVRLELPQTLGLPLTALLIITISFLSASLVIQLVKWIRPIAAIAKAS